MYETGKLRVCFLCSPAWGFVRVFFLFSSWREKYITICNCKSILTPLHMLMVLGIVYRRQPVTGTVVATLWTEERASYSPRSYHCLMLCSNAWIAVIYREALLTVFTHGRKCSRSQRFSVLLQLVQNNGWVSLFPLFFCRNERQENTYKNTLSYWAAPEGNGRKRARFSGYWHRLIFLSRKRKEKSLQNTLH